MMQQHEGISLYVSLRESASMLLLVGLLQDVLLLGLLLGSSSSHVDQVVEPL